MIILLQRKLEEFKIWVTVAVEGVGTCTSRVQIKWSKSHFFVLSSNCSEQHLDIFSTLSPALHFQLPMIPALTVGFNDESIGMISVATDHPLFNWAGYVKTMIMQNTEELVVRIAAVTKLILYDLLELYSWVKLRLLQEKKRTCYEDLSVLHKPAPSPWWATVWQKPLLRDLHTWFLCLSVYLSDVSRRVILRFDRCCITDHISACRRSVEFPELCVYHRARRGKKNCLTERSSLLMCTTTTVKDPCAVLQTFLQSALDLDNLPLKL